MTTIGDHDFSFPTSTDTLRSGGIDSPPLWRLSPTASPTPRLRKTNQESEPEPKPEREKYYYTEFDHLARKLMASSYMQQRKSFSCVDQVLIDGSISDEDYEEEKMDMLWEDFNEEIILKMKSSGQRNNTSRVDTEVVGNLGCVEGFKLPKTNVHGGGDRGGGRGGAIVTPRKPSMVVLFKVLKKLFLMHNNSHRSVKTGHNFHRPVKKSHII